MNDLFDACFRIDRGASEAAGHHIPLVVENVKGAQPWVGCAAWHFGSYYLWGDVPALMPVQKAVKTVSHQRESDAVRNDGGSWFGVAHNTESGHGRNPVSGEYQRDEDAGVKMRSSGHYKKPGSGPDWFDGGPAAYSSRSDSRKAASARIAKIPFPLANWIARVYKPDSARA